MSNMVPKVAKTLTEKQAILGKVADKVNEKAGKKLVGFIGKDPEIMEKLRIKFIPTPSVDVNDALGGGWPKGRISIASGLSDSGKTSLLLETIAYNMKKDPEFVSVWLESENSLQKEYVCDTFGIDPDRFFFIDHDHKGAGEGALELLTSVLEAGVADIAVVNSLKMLVPSEEFKKDIKDTTIAVQARMNSRFMRKVTAMVSESECALVIVQHLSTEIGGFSMGDPMILSGGHAIRYAASIITDQRKKSVLDTDPIKRDEGIKVGFAVKKNHCVPSRNPYVRTDYFAIFGQGIEQYLTLIDKAVEQGVLVKSGGFYKHPDADNNPVVRNDVKYQWQGKEKLRQFMLDNPEYFEEIKARVAGEVVSMTEEEINALKQDEAATAEAAKHLEEVAEDTAAAIAAKSKKKK